MFRRTDPLAQELGLNEPETITQSCENCVSYNDAVENACNYGYNAGPGMKCRYWILNKDDEIESRLDALYNTIQARDETIRDNEATCAAYREALQNVVDTWVILSGDRKDMDLIHAALAPDAGAALLERLKKAEAERVEVVKVSDYCRYSGCYPYTKRGYDADSESCMYCEVPRYFKFLRDNRMIREAE